MAINNSREILKWHECSCCDSFLPSWPSTSSTPPICTSTCTHKHVSTHTSREINAPTHMYTKCFVIPCDLYTWHLFHGSSILHVSGLLWTRPSTVYQPWMASLPTGSLSGMLASCLSDWVGIMQVVGWLTGFLAGKQLLIIRPFSTMVTYCHRLCFGFYCSPASLEAHLKAITYNRQRKSLDPLIPLSFVPQM